MKTMIYRGRKANLGRFGVVDKGARLEVTELEFETVKTNPDFELIKSKKPERAAEYIPPVPIKTPFLDLRHINWLQPKLALILDRQSKSRILQIGRAMKHLGIPVEIGERLQKRMIIDSIIEQARDLGWLTLEQVMPAPPVVAPKVPVAAAPAPKPTTPALAPAIDPAAKKK